MRFLAPFLLALSWGATATIPSGYIRIANDHGIPADIFYALASQESRVTTSKGRVIPWPWTINHKGKGVRFNSRVEMYTYCKQLLDAGDISFDIGALQVNWKWHKQRFNNDLWLATNPKVNVKAAAQYLAELFDVEKDWWVAVGRYHSPNNKKLAESHRKRVYTQWQKITSGA